MASVLKEVELAIPVKDTPGADRLVLSALLEQGVEVRALCAYNDGEKTMVLLVAEDALRAKQALAKAGFECKANPVVVVGLESRIGAVAQLGEYLYKAGIEILRSYSSYTKGSEMVAVFKTHDDARAIEILRASLQAAAPEHAQDAAA
jgi:hypothetical protein